MNLHQQISMSCTLGAPAQHRGLAVIPVFDTASPELPEIMLLEEALSTHQLVITEVDKGGQVPNLRAENTGNQAVLILEGEELIGGKQNRILNTTVLVLPGTFCLIPVSCMEQGRWRHNRDDFAAGGALFRASSRAINTASVMVSLKESASFAGDQGAVWDEVELSLNEFAAPSATRDFRATRARVGQDLEAFVAALPSLPTQIGGLFFNSAGWLGAELLASPELYARSTAKIIRSFALDALSESPPAGNMPQEALMWWQRILEASLTLRPSIGAGQDLRCDTPHIVGSGLLWRDAVIHFSCFPRERKTATEPRRTVRRASARQRRERMV